MTDAIFKPCSTKLKNMFKSPVWLMQKASFSNVCVTFQ